jgi:hypothetical protein
MHNYHNEYSFILQPCIIVETVTVSIRSIPPATSIIGENFTLQCSAKGAGDYLTQIKWLNSDGMTIQNNIISIHGQLQFIPLQVSHNGEYICQATVENVTFNESYTVHVGLFSKYKFNIESVLTWQIDHACIPLQLQWYPVVPSTSLQSQILQQFYSRGLFHSTLEGSPTTP